MYECSWFNTKIVTRLSKKVKWLQCEICPPVSDLHGAYHPRNYDASNLVVKAIETVVLSRPAHFGTLRAVEPSLKENRGDRGKNVRRILGKTFRFFWFDFNLWYVRFPTNTFARDGDAWRT
jgi:hypothetical protein